MTFENQFIALLFQGLFMGFAMGFSWFYLVAGFFIGLRLFQSWNK